MATARAPETRTVSTIRHFLHAIESIWSKLENNSKKKEIHKVAHAGWQKGGVPEEAEIGRTSTIRDFLHALQAPSMTAYPRNAVSAAEPLCTHGKDHAGLGAPNSLKLLLQQ